MITQIRLGISNVFLVKGARPILVDTGMPHEGQRIVDALAGHGVKLSDLSLIVHTHGHWDHCGSSWQLRTWTKAPLAIHAADADKMRLGDKRPLKPTSFTAWLARPFINKSFPGTEPDVLLEPDTDLNAYGVDARIISTPGHTAGSISIVTRQGEAIVGDLVMGGYLGGRLFSSRPTLHYFAEDVAEVKRSIKKLLEENSISRVYVSHGGPLEPSAIVRRLL